jgi:hypothetical protein
MRVALYAVLGCILCIALYFGLQNRPDPEWISTTTLLQQEFVMLDQSVDSAEALYNTWHGLPTESIPHDSTAFKILAKDYLPTMEWSKFRTYFDLVSKQKAAVIASINGSGASTLTNRLAHFMATTPQHVLHISAAPQYDLMLHAKYIGEEQNGKWQKGALLQLFDHCIAHPNEKFVTLIDNFDKINPETFFGPELWEILDDRGKKARLADITVSIPENFYLITVTHAGLSSKVDLTNEHFRRLGGQHILPVSAEELVVYLRNRAKELTKKRQKATEPKDIAQLDADLAALKDTNLMIQFVYAFKHTNEKISALYSPNHQLGQWSNVRKLFKPSDREQLQTTFINHINALKPNRPFSKKDFKDLEYTLAHNGLAPRSSFIFQGVSWLQDTGYFIEITLILATSVVTSLVGWWLLRRRERILRQYGERTRSIFNQYENHDISSDFASKALRDIKAEIDQLVLERKLNYTEALYFLGFIDDKVRQIDFARETAQTFQDLYESFAEDGIFTDSEYKKLTSFLNSIKLKIPNSEYDRFVGMVEGTKRE